jgi:DNA-directed RNA polymerase subunit H (RpoH/RPB5)
VSGVTTTHFFIEMSFLFGNPDRCRNILRTTEEMLTDRGFQVTDPPLLVRQQWRQNSALADEHYRTHECLLTAQKGPDTLLVMASHEEKLAIDTVRKYLEEYKDQPHTLVLVIYQTITPSARQTLETCKRFQLFQEKDLFHNKTHHSLYVPHRGLSPDEEKEILHRYQASKSVIPPLYKGDAIARYFNWPVGTMIEIHRRIGGSMEPTRDYRVVVEDP